ncbi:helix-turn-helix domain-containing protein [Streptomyces sp. NPDC058424]|uniref:helix-turn-helix domain-containing protein n=1 Tax=Streptomyces sp. NPDC058424 TaxID=3346491 RepID=UPI003649DB89
MSTEAMKWAIELAPPMPSQLVGTLVGLAYHADKQGRGAYPSLARLAAYACKAERSVRRDLRQLEDLKLIRPGDPLRAAHIPADRRPEVYDLAVERVVPKGRAGDDEGTRTSARTLVSSRERGRATREAKKTRSGTECTQERADVDVRGDADVRADVDVTHGRTWTSQRGDAHVTDDRTPTSAKPSEEPSENRQVNQWGAEDYPNHPPHMADLDALAPAPIDVDGFTVTDTMRRWAHATYPGLNIDHSTAQFISHYRSTGTRRKSWPDAWQKWIRDDAKRAADRAARQTQGTFLVALNGGGQTPTPPLTGTDATVAGWAAVAAQLGNQPTDEDTA